MHKICSHKIELRNIEQDDIKVKQIRDQYLEATVTLELPTCPADRRGWYKRNLAALHAK